MSNQGNANSALRLAEQSVAGHLTTSHDDQLAAILMVDRDAARARRLAAAIEARMPCRVVFDPRHHLDLVVLVAPETADRAAEVRRYAPAPVIVVAEAATDSAVTDWIAAGAEDVVSTGPAEAASAGDSVIRAFARLSRRVRLTATTPEAADTMAADAKGQRRGKGRLNSLVAFLQAAAHTDCLTGLANRRALDARLDRLFGDSLRDGSDLSLLMIDIDNFKHANDQLGHAKGDELLLLLSDVLRSQCRRGDLAARFGGDELVVLLPRAAAEEAQAVGERIRLEFAARVQGGPCAGLSVGVASRRRSGALSPRELLVRADDALYAAKRSGKGCTRLCDDAARLAAAM